LIATEIGATYMVAAYNLPDNRMQPGAGGGS